MLIRGASKEIGKRNLMINANPFESYLVPESKDAANFTDEKAQDAVGSILTDSNSIDFTYTDATPSITADVILNGGTLEITADGLQLTEGGHDLNLHSDVNYNSIADKQILRYDNSTSKFINAYMTIADCNDFDQTGLADSRVVIWDADIGTGSFTTAELSSLESFKVKAVATEGTAPAFTLTDAGYPALALFDMIEDASYEKFDLVLKGYPPTSTYNNSMFFGMHKDDGIGWHEITEIANVTGANNYNIKIGYDDDHCVNDIDIFAKYAHIGNAVRYIDFGMQGGWYGLLEITARELVIDATEELKITTPNGQTPTEGQVLTMNDDGTCDWADAPTPTSNIENGDYDGSIPTWNDSSSMWKSFNSLKLIPAVTDIVDLQYGRLKITSTDLRTDNSLTNVLALASDGEVKVKTILELPSGTSAGQLLFWDNTNTEWDIADFMIATDSGTFTELRIKEKTGYTITQLNVFNTTVASSAAKVKIRATLYSQLLLENTQLGSGLYDDFKIESDWSAHKTILSVAATGGSRTEVMAITHNTGYLDVKTTIKTGSLTASRIVKTNTSKELVSCDAGYTGDVTIDGTTLTFTDGILTAVS